jgi:RNA polymerase sigma-70 factor (ECF subfamily)
MKDGTLETHDSTDAELVRLAASGNETAFNQLYQRYRLPLYGFLSRKLNRQGTLTDDIFQQTWVRVADSLNRYEERQKFSSWLFRIAQNLVIDYYRQQKHAMFEEIEEHHANTEANALTSIDDRELSKRLWDAIDELPPEQRDVVMMRQRQLSFKEIAEIQKTGINTVLGRMHYAVQSLRRKLQEYQE